MPKRSSLLALLFASATLTVADASSAAAEGSSQPKPLAIYFLGDSITAGTELLDPLHEAYPWLIGERLGATVTNLAKGGAAAGSDSEGDVIRSQLFLVRAPCDVATINVGTNDISLMASGYYTIADYDSNVELIVDVLRETCARVIVTTVINNAWNALAIGRDKVNWSKDVRRENAYLASLSGVTLVDLNADGRLHEQTSFTAPTLLHPNAAGQRAIAEDIEHAIAAPHESVR